MIESGPDHFLVTGALGCIGAWVVKNLLVEGVPVTLFDRDVNLKRLRLLLDDASLSRTSLVQGDVANLSQVDNAIQESRATHVIHLAGLQVPFCRANPSLGAAVNVTGTINVLESIRRAGSKIQGFAYASSVAVFGPESRYPPGPVDENATLAPDTLYGVYKQANEHSARVFWQNWAVPSVGLRPYIVYGVGRDQGLTSDITKAILAAAANQPFHINFGGMVALQYADDVAKIFIGAARAAANGALICNLRNDVVSVSDFVSVLLQQLPDSNITFDASTKLPFPADLADDNLVRLLGKVPYTPMAAAIGKSVVQFRHLLAANQISGIPIE